MIITGVKLFLRVEEVVEMKIEDFVERYFVVTENNVEGLCVLLDGKREKKETPFAIWDDKDCPEFSAVKAIMLWLSFSGICSGYIFPDRDELNRRSTSPTQHYTYSSMLDTMKFLCERVLGVDTDSPEMKHLIIGTHILRRTAFLLAYWGFLVNGHCKTNKTLFEMDEGSILLSARHQHIDCMTNYLADSGTLDRIDPNNPHHRVGLWQPIHMKTLHQFAALNIKSTQYIKSLPDLSAWYCFQIIHLPANLNITVIQAHGIAFLHTGLVTQKPIGKTAPRKHI
jgi:hypothetical protein